MNILILIITLLSIVWVIGGTFLYLTVVSYGETGRINVSKRGMYIVVLLCGPVAWLTESVYLFIDIFFKWIQKL